MVFVTCVFCCELFLCFAFFFFKQKTAYEMRISDWSSDVCSSDLGAEAVARIVAMLFGIAIGERGKAERAGVGRHVKAIGEQRHRPGSVTRRDFRNHQDRTSVV